MRNASLLSILLVLCCSGLLAAQNGVDPARRAVAAPSLAPPILDGIDVDPVWATASVISDFRQYEPDDEAEPSLPTAFQIGYDDRNLYIFVRAYDPHPDSIMRALSRRDVSAPSDEITLSIDSYFDRRTGYEFAVNPDGVKRDFAIYNDSDRDSSWDGVWEVATRVDSIGWTAEFRIPLSQLRYADAPSHTFGFGVVRDIERYSERVSWPAIDRDDPGFVSQLGAIDGFRGLSTSRSIEVTPYTVLKTESNGSAASGGRQESVTLGADVKLRVTPNVTVDATVNPDFGQVEADPADLNLSAFETFLTERRPFFIEGIGLYRFQLNCYIVVDCQTNEGLFYSRRIGRSPYLRETHGTGSTPAATPIAVASKLTGRTRRGLSFGLLDAVTREVEGLGGAIVEPRTNYAVFSAEQDLRNGLAGARLIATSVNRAGDPTTSPQLHSGAHLAGLSVRNRMFEGNYEIAALVAASRVTGSAEAIGRTQRNAVHYFQQPGDDLEEEAGATSLSGYSTQLKFGKYGGGITRFETSFVRHSPGFEPNDLGYLRRADQQDWSTWAALRFNTPTRVYRWLQVNGNHWQTWNTSGTRLEAALNTNFHMGLHNNWDVHAGATLNGLWGSFCDRCTRGGPVLRVSPGFHPWFGVNGDSRRILVPSVWVNLDYMDEGASHRVSVSPELEVRLAAGVQGSIGVNIRRNHDQTQWVDNFVDEDDRIHHTFARLDQRTLSLTLRLNYTATPNLSFEFYGEPFVSTGTYSEFRELSSTPDASRYADRFVPSTPPSEAPRGFTFRQLRTNAVLRWEYLPGSTLFLVWAHGRERAGNEPSTLGWSQEYRELFDLQPDHTFLLKVAYWFNR